MPTRYTTQEVADILGVTDGRVRQLAKDMRINRKFGRARYFTPGDVERMKQRDTTTGPKGPRHTSPGPIPRAGKEGSE